MPLTYFSFVSSCRRWLFGFLTDESFKPRWGSWAEKVFNSLCWMNALKYSTPQKSKATQIPVIYIVSFRVLIDIWRYLFICFYLLAYMFICFLPSPLKVKLLEGMLVSCLSSLLLRTVLVYSSCSVKTFSPTNKSWHIHWELLQTVWAPLHIETLIYQYILDFV